MHTSEFTDEYQDWLHGTPMTQQASWLHLTLGEMRQAEPLRVLATDTTEHVIRWMNESHESAALVMHEGALVGIFTERDVLARVVPRIDGLFAAVRDMMTPNPEVLDESTLLCVAIRRLSLGRYHHLPVVNDQGRPTGIVSLRTILGYLVDAFPQDILNAPPQRDSYPPSPEGA